MATICAMAKTCASTLGLFTKTFIIFPDPTSAHQDVGLAASTLRQPFDQVLQGKETGGTGNHRSAEQGGHQSTKLCHPTQAQAGNVQTGGAAEKCSRHRNFRPGCGSTVGIRIQSEECRLVGRVNQKYFRTYRFFFEWFLFIMIFQNFIFD